MRLARKLFLVAVAAIAMIAFSAQAANAVEVSAEDGAHCPEVDATNAHVVSGGCAVEAETGDATPATLRTHATMGGETVFSICDNTFTAALHESGDGYIYNQVLSGASCAITPCDEAEPSHANIPWPATLMEFGAVKALQTTFCIRPVALAEGAAFSTCTVYVPFTEPTDHAYSFNTLAFGAHETPPWASRCSQNAQTSLTGGWTIHGTGLEINH